MIDLPATRNMPWRRRAIDRWNDFFFAEEPVYPAIYFRVLLGLWTVVFFLPRLPYVRELYNAGPIRVSHPLLALLGGVPELPMWGVWLVLLALFAFAIAFAAGYRARQVHLPIVALLCYLFGYDVSTVRGYGQLAFYQWLVMYCVPYDRLRDASGAVVYAPRWGLRLAMALFSSVYLFSVFAKTIGGDGWFDGRTLYYTLRGNDYGTFLLSAWIPISLGVARVLGWITLGCECFIGLGLWHRRTARFAMLTCVGMHTMMALSMRVSILFHLLMIGHLPLFFAPPTWERISALRRNQP